MNQTIAEGQLSDIVLEVIHTKPILDNLEVYRGFAVGEVWLFQDGAFELYRLEDDRYARIERGVFLPELDFELLGSQLVAGDGAFPGANARLCRGAPCSFGGRSMPVRVADSSLKNRRATTAEVSAACAPEPPTWCLAHGLPVF